MLSSVMVTKMVATLTLALFCAVPDALSNSKWMGKSVTGMIICMMRLVKGAGKDRGSDSFALLLAF